MNLSESTAKWLTTTIASWVLVALFVAANLKEPLISLDPTLAVGLLVAGLAGLGITQFSAYSAVKVNQEITQ